jgi:two-component system cell cycle sensor histidine kinase/response regulator CckA
LISFDKRSPSLGHRGPTGRPQGDGEKRGDSMSGKPACEELQKKLTKLERKICDQQQVQQRLEESNIEMLDMLESISDGFFSLDDDYVLTYFNRAAEKVLGRKSWEVLGRRLFEAFPEMKGSIFETRFEQTLKEQIPISFETYFPVKPYENWYEVRIYPRKSGLSVFFQVTTEHHRIAEATRKLEAQLRQAERLRATAKLAGGIANDFNNLLSVIQSSASLLLFNLESTHPHYPTLKDIEKQARDGSRLSAQLLGYSRKGRYSVKPFDLNELVKETLKTFGEEKNEGGVELELAGDLSAVQGDRNQIGNVLLSLYANSVEAMTSGGKLAVRTANTTHRDMEGKPWDPVPGRYVLVAIGDTGIGMDEKTREKVFAPFSTTKKTDRHSGLGLAAVYGIAKGHGGYIDMDSEQGRGTAFRIYLPALDKNIEERQEGTEGVAGAQGTILLVDDDDSILDVGGTMLRRLGYGVIKAKGGMEAIRFFEEEGEHICLVILDMIMPDMNGGEVFKKIVGMNDGIRVLLSTGTSPDGQVRDILKKGGAGFIQKPFGIRELSEKITEVLGNPERC